jgi:nitrite reductase (NADH) small subunit/3-phenylpropionate/trans-cinnamate dioxygenase ferredoxin subunit
MITPLSGDGMMCGGIRSRRERSRLGEFTKVGVVSQFREGRGRTVQIGERTLAIFRRGDRIFAMDDECPHMGASLALGRLVEDHVECEWHHWRFDLSTGQNAYKEWARVAIHEVRVRGDDVLVRIVEPVPGDQPSAGEDDDWFVWDPDKGVAGSGSDPGESS